MHCKPCEVCPIAEVCGQSAIVEAKCPVVGATEKDTVKHDYKED